MGNALTSACETVPEIWLRAASITIASPLTVTLDSTAAIDSVIGSSNAAPAPSVRLR